jgi:hypothetical protein
MKRAPVRELTIRGFSTVAGALVWFCGLHALPFLHNLDHRSDHTHAAPSHSHSHLHANDLAHADRHVHPHVQQVPPVDDDGRGPSDPDHGEGSLLHFAAVVVVSQPAMLPQLSYNVMPASTERVFAVDTPALLAFLARGPPTH